MTSDSLCSKFAHAGEMPVLAYKQEFEEKKKISDNLAAKIDNMNRILEARRDSQHSQTTQNTISDTTNNLVYNQTMDKKIPKAVEVTINGRPMKESFENINDINSPSQRATSVQFKNIDAIVDDSDLVVIQENYNYILWCILAVITSIVVVKTLRKQQ
jgi:protein involved in temperature-dependent protein secretion